MYIIFNQFFTEVHRIEEEEKVLLAQKIEVPFR
jgi:hypothetical protein